MTDDTGVLIDRVHALLSGPPRPPAAIEVALTDGYARALVLQAERRRLEQRITELAAALADDVDSTHVSELAELAGRRSRADGDLSRLQAALQSLRSHLAAARAAQPSSAV